MFSQESVKRRQKKQHVETRKAIQRTTTRTCPDPKTNSEERQRQEKKDRRSQPARAN